MNNTNSSGSQAEEDGYLSLIMASLPVTPEFDALCEQAAITAYTIEKLR